MAVALDNLIIQATTLLDKYNGAMLLMEQNATNMSASLKTETDNSIALLKAEISVLDVGATIASLQAEGAAQVAAVQAETTNAVTAVQAELAVLDVATIMADFQAQADAILLQIQTTVTSSANGLPAIVDSNSFACNVNANCTIGSSTYSSLMKLDNNRFAIVKLLYGGGATEATITPITVDVNGVITKSTSGQMFVNTSGAGISTTEFFTADGTGKIFALGNNMYPAQTAHVFGYFYGSVDVNNAIVNVGAVVNTAYHKANGQWGGMLDAAGTGFYSVAPSYDQTTSKDRHIRIDYSGATPALNIVDPLSDTSTGYSAKFIGQTGVSNLNITGIMHSRTSATAYFERAYNSTGAYTDYPVPNWDSQMIAFVLSNGTVLNITSGASGYMAAAYTSYNARTVVNNLDIDISYFYPYWANGNVTNVGVDTWVAYNYSAKVAFSFKIDPVTYAFTILDSQDLGLIAGTSSNTFIKTAGANHEYLLIMQSSSSAYQNVKTVANTLNLV